MINLFKHLLPSGAPWSIIANKVLRKLFAGLALVAEGFKSYVDLVWEDLFPTTTRELDRWDTQFGLSNGTGLSTAVRRSRVSAAWLALGGQSAHYIQSVLREAGFDVYVHECFTAGIPSYRCGEARAYCGNTAMVCKQNPILRNPSTVLAANNTNVPEGKGYPLTNRTPFMEYAVTPTNPQYYPRVLYIGGQTFGTLASVPLERREELEVLCLKLRPAHLWLGMLIEFTGAPTVYMYGADADVYIHNGDILLK